MKEVVGYVRVSVVGQRGGDSFLSPTLQREQIAVMAAREGLEVVEVIEELDASGGDATRPGFERALSMVESGRVGGIAVWNLSRWTRSLPDGVATLARIEAAGGRLYSATEQFGEDAGGRLYRNILLSIAQSERERAAAGFRQARASAVERGITVAGKIPLGYRRRADRRLEVDPDAAPLVQHAFEMKAAGKGHSAIARWLNEQGCDFTSTGVRYMLSNRAYRGETRAGDLVKESTHPALVTEGLFRRAQGRGKQSQRTGRLAGRFLLGGVATCANCGRGLRLSSGGSNHRPFYYCRGRDCRERGYAGARELDAFVLNTIEERTNAADPSTWVALPGGDDAEVAELEAARDAAAEDLESFLADTKMRRALGADRHAEAAGNYVAVLDKAEADLAEARERTSGSWELVGRLWNTEWGHAERAEWVARTVRSVVVSKGREPLSRRCEVELR